MKKLFAVVVLGSLAVVGCEKPASSKAPPVKTSPGAAPSTGAPEADKMKGEKMAKEASEKAKAEAEKPKADAEKKAPEPAKDKDGKKGDK